MATSTHTKKTDIYEQHYRANLKTANLKLQLKKAANDICLQIELFFSKQNTDRAIFNIADLKKKTGYKDSRTILTSLEQINKIGIFYIRAVTNDKFIVLAPKESNIKFVEALDSNDEDYLIWILKHTKESGKINKILSEAKSKVASLFSGIVTKHQDVEKKHSNVKKQHQDVEKKHHCAYSYLSKLGDYQVLEQVENNALDLFSLDLFLINHQSLEANNEDQNLSKTETLNDDDLLNKISFNKTTTELVVNKDFNNSESKDTLESKDNLMRVTGDVGAGVNKNIPPVRPADCGQLTDEGFIKNASPAIKALYKEFKFDKNTYNLLELFAAAKNAEGKNINFNLETALDLIQTCPEKVIKAQLEYLPHRTDANGKPVGAGYLIKLIKAHSMEAPTGYTVKAQKEQENKEIELYTKVGQIWGYNGRIGNINSAFMEVTRLVKSLFDSGKIDEIKEKIKETAKLINPFEVIKKDYLELVEVI